MRLGHGRPAAATLALVGALAAAAPARADRRAEAAIAAIERVHPELLAPARPARFAGRSFAPHFSAVARESHTWRLAGAATSGEVRGDGPEPGGVVAFVGLPQGWSEGGTVLVGSSAIVQAEAAPATDVIVRPLPLGFAVYLLLRSARAAERVALDSNLGCEGGEFQRRLAPGVFEIAEGAGEDPSLAPECGSYSHSGVAAWAPGPLDTLANLRHERALWSLARRRSAAEHASPLLLVAASAARDERGRIVPTEMSWRYPAEPFLRIRHRGAHPAYPLLVRLDVLSER